MRGRSPTARTPHGRATLRRGRPATGRACRPLISSSVISTQRAGHARVFRARCASQPEPIETLATRLYEEGLIVNGVGGWLLAAPVGCGVASGAHLSMACSAGRTRCHGRPAPWAQVRKGRQAARRKAEPPGGGVKGWLVVSMCQIASVSLRAMSIWATFAPRCLPSRRLLRW
jgi:hypothetical protein